MAAVRVLDGFAGADSTQRVERGDVNRTRSRFSQARESVAGSLATAASGLDPGAIDGAKKCSAGKHCHRFYQLSLIDSVLASCTRAVKGGAEQVTKLLIRGVRLAVARIRQTGFRLGSRRCPRPIFLRTGEKSTQNLQKRIQSTKRLSTHAIRKRLKKYAPIPTYH